MRFARRAARMRIIVCGSRQWHDRKPIIDRLAELPDPASVTIVHGGARGADRIAHQEAQKLGLLTEVHHANWERYGKRAGIIRNYQMAQLGADLCIAFWDRRSSGTEHMINQAKLHGIPVEIIDKK